MIRISLTIYLAVCIALCGAAHAESAETAQLKKRVVAVEAQLKVIFNEIKKQMVAEADHYYEDEALEVSLEQLRTAKKDKELKDKVAAVPFAYLGRPWGVRIVSVDRRNIFTLMGFQSGDVIKLMDDEDFTDPAELMALLDLKETPLREPHKFLVERSDGRVKRNIWIKLHVRE